MATKQDSHSCGNEDVKKAVSECLQQMLKVIEEDMEEEEIVSLATLTQNHIANNIPATLSNEQDDEGVKLAVTDPTGTYQENSGDSETNSKNPPSSSVASDSQHADSNLQRLLPHEGLRWARLRDKIETEPQFEEYASRVRGEAQWSLDEAFISFCLDRVDEVLANPLPANAHQRPEMVIQKTKKTTRRKGQPRKYERTPNDNSATIQAEKNLYANTNFLMEPFEDEEYEEDPFSMDDNSDDLDYTPLSIIRYKRPQVENCQEETVQDVPGMKSRRFPWRC
ncbi:uncharacterized protein LOC119741464 isoform X2 [Patiria miniata]|uniref:Uncharacterized protein n=1 Tax=Patiria miniata TaxID=46514 RepID=A0A914BBD2_PATMI|nr:uncharacterized protein LOC119741464 isoform X2 [Patiria miniata]